MHSAWPGDGKEVPVDGTEIKLRIIAFPGGSVREIYLDKGARTHPHDSYEDVLFYQIDGRRVQMCKEHCHELNAGDATLEPAGIQHSTYQLVGGLFLEFAFPAPLQPAAEATWINADQAPTIEVAEWLEDGKTVRVTSTDVLLAPLGAAHYSVRRFELPRYPLFETRIPQGTALLPRIDKVDQLLYVVSGKLNVTMNVTMNGTMNVKSADRHGVIRDTVVTGDSLRSVAGHGYHFTALEDSVLVHTAIPSSSVV